MQSANTSVWWMCVLSMCIVMIPQGDGWHVQLVDAFLSNSQCQPYHEQLMMNVTQSGSINTLRPRQNGRHFADDTFKRIFVNENVRISIRFSLKFVPKGPINNIPALVQIMAWRRPGYKPLSESVMVSLMTHICVTRPQSVKHVSVWQVWHSMTVWHSQVQYIINRGKMQIWIQTPINTLWAHYVVILWVLWRKLTSVIVDPYCGNLAEVCNAPGSIVVMSQGCGCQVQCIDAFLSASHCQHEYVQLLVIVMIC